MKSTYTTFALLLSTVAAQRSVCTQGAQAGLAYLTLVPGAIRYCSTRFPVPTVTSTIPVTATTTAPTSTSTFNTVGTVTQYEYTTTVTVTTTSGSAPLKRDLLPRTLLVKRDAAPAIITPSPSPVGTSIGDCHTVTSSQTQVAALNQQKEALKKRQLDIAPLLGLPVNIVKTFCSCAQTITPTTSSTTTYTSTTTPVTITTVTTSISTATVQTASTSTIVFPRYCNSAQKAQCTCSCYIRFGGRDFDCASRSSGAICSSDADCSRLTGFPQCLVTGDGTGRCVDRCPRVSKRDLEEIFDRYQARNEKMSRRNAIVAEEGA